MRGEVEVAFMRHVPAYLYAPSTSSVAPVATTAQMRSGGAGSSNRSLDARSRVAVSPHMSQLQATVLLVLLILPATGQADDAAPSFFYPTDPDYLLINARETMMLDICGET